MTTFNKNLNAGFVTDKFPTTVVGDFGELSVRERTPQFSLISNVNLSAIRDIQIITTGGAVTHGGPNVASEYKLATTATANASIRLESADTGRFQPGSGGEATIGVRLENIGSITGNQVLRWGYFDNSDGFGFGYSTQGLFVFTLRSGVETRILRTNWNVDKLDANGPSGVDINLLFGHAFIIDFSWFGVASFQILHNDPITNEQRRYTCHRHVPTLQTSSLNPNLPISASISNGSTAAVAPNLYVSGRSFAVVGRYNPITRHTSAFRGQISVPSANWIPLINVRQKTDFRAVKNKASGYDIIVATNTVRLLYMLNTSIVSPTWTVPTLHTAAETCLEIDVAATLTDNTLAAGAGTKLWSAVHTAGQGSQTNFSNTSFDFTIPAFSNYTVSILARALTGTATVDFLPRFIEEW